MSRESSVAEGANWLFFTDALRGFPRTDVARGFLARQALECEVVLPDARVVAAGDDALRLETARVNGAAAFPALRFPFHQTGEQAHDSPLVGARLQRSLVKETIILTFTKNDMVEHPNPREVSGFLQPGSDANVLLARRGVA